MGKGAVSKLSFARSHLVFRFCRRKLQLMSELVQDVLDIECGALSGANVADQVAEECFSVGRSFG
jgi:hypothetical protein